MRYLVASERFFLDAPGGAYRVAWELARLLRSDGHEVALLCGGTDGDPPIFREDVEGVQVVRYRVPKTFGLDPTRLAKHVTEARSAARFLFDSGPWDVIHAHAPIQAVATLPRVAGKSRRIYTVHSPAVMEQAINWAHAGPAGLVKRAVGLPLLKRYESEALRRADIVHVLSDYTKHTMETLYPSELRGKTVRVPWWPLSPGACVGKAEARRRLGLEPTAKLLFTVRRMVPRMGLDILLEAAEELARLDFQLVLGGEGPQRASLEARAARGPLKDRVIFPGRLTDAELGWAYEACDAFVLPSIALECFGVIAVEAMAYDRPVLGSDVGAIPELIRPILPGWLFRAGDVDDLRRALASYLRGELKTPPVGVLAAYAENHFGRSRLEGEYRNMVAGRAATA